jgi:hypothetical protein
LYALVRHAMQHPFNDYRPVPIDIAIEHTLGSDGLLMTPSVAELRFIDSVDDQSHGSRGIPAPNEEEMDPQTSEFAKRRTEGAGT